MSSYEKFREGSDPVSLERADLEGKNVLVRVDFNCPSKEGNLTDNYRIRESLGTLNLLRLKKANKITIITHWGRPDGVFDASSQVEPLRKELEDLIGESVVCPEYSVDYNEYSKKIQNEHSLIVMWDNIRFWPEEEKNDENFSKALALGQDIFINEAFSASHRSHASVTGVARLLPSYAGLRLGEEIREIYRLMVTEVEPSLAIIGGAKIETKIPLLRSLAKHYSKIILGGKVAIEWENYKEKLTFEDTEWTEKLLLPEGFQGEERLDIDEQSIVRFVEMINNAKKIVWNGPVGKFEEPDYARGSEEIAKAISSNKEALRLVGGGDTILVLDSTHLNGQVGFVSTGGGAMLDYIADGNLPGIEGLDF